MQAAEDDAVRVEDVDEPGEAEAQPVDEDLGGRADRRVVRTRRGAGRRPAGAATPRGRGRGPPPSRKASGSASTSRQPRLPQWQGRPSGLTVRWPTSRARPELPVCRRPSSTSAPPTPRWPVATHSRSRAPRPGAVPVLGERGEVDVVAGEGRSASMPGRPHATAAKISRTGAPAGQARCSGLRAVPSGSATADGTARPAPTQRRPVLAQQFRAGLDDRAEHLRRVGVDGHAAGRGGHDPAAEAHQRGPEPVGVHLRGQHDRAVLGDVEPVRGAALRAGRPRRAGCPPGSARAPPARRRPRPPSRG